MSCYGGTVVSQCDGHAPHSRPQRQGRGGPSVQADALARAGRGTGVSAGGLSSSVVPSFSRPSPGTEASVGPAVTAAGSGDRSHALHSAAAIPFAEASWVSRSEATKEEHFVTKGEDTGEGERSARCTRSHRQSQRPGPHEGAFENTVRIWGDEAPTSPRQRPRDVVSLPADSLPRVYFLYRHHASCSCH